MHYSCYCSTFWSSLMYRWRISSFWCTITLSSGQQHCNSGLNKVYLTWIFSVRHMTAFLRLGTLGSALALRLGGHWKQWNHEQKAQQCEKCGTSRLQKGHLLILWPKTRWQSTAFFEFRWQCAQRAILSFCCAAHGLKWLRKCHKYWFWGYTYLLSRPFCKNRICE